MANSDRELFLCPLGIDASFFPEGKPSEFLSRDAVRCPIAKVFEVVFL